MAALDNMLSAIGAVGLAVITFALTRWHERSERRADEQLKALDLLLDCLDDYRQWQGLGDDPGKRTSEVAVKMRLSMASKLGFRYEPHWEEAINSADDMQLADVALELNIAWLAETRKKVNEAADRLAELAVKYNRQSYTLTVIDKGGWRLRRRKRKVEEMFRLHDLARRYAAGELILVTSRSEGR